MAPFFPHSFSGHKNVLSIVVILLALNNGPQACKLANEYYSLRILNLFSHYGESEALAAAQDAIVLCL